MQCQSDKNCPILYTCIQSQCQHAPITTLSPQIILSIFLLPFLIGLSNRIGHSTLWISYPVLMVILAYEYPQNLGLMAPLAFAAGVVMVYLGVREKGDKDGNKDADGAGPAVNFYVVSVVMPVLVVGMNMGLVLGRIVPFLYVAVLGCILCIIFLILTSNTLKDIQAGQKITLGHFRKMLPSRLQSRLSQSTPPPTIQLALIQQSDNELDQHEHSHQLSPTRKSKIRQQLLQQKSNAFPIQQFVVCLMGFTAYQCLCLSLPEFMAWLGLQPELGRIGAAYGVGIGLMVIGELYLYKFYVQPMKIQEESIKLNLGLRMDGIKMLQLCCLGFIGGLFQGLIGFGFSLTLFFHLLQTETPLKNTISTTSYLNIFLSSILTLHQIFCPNFNWLSFLILFLLTLIVSIGFQYLFNTYLDNHVMPDSINSTLLVMVGVVLVLALTSFALGLGLSWGRFGGGRVLGVVGRDC